MSDVDAAPEPVHDTSVPAAEVHGCPLTDSFGQAVLHVPLKRYADVIIPLGGHNTVAVDLLLTMLRSVGGRPVAT